MTTDQKPARGWQHECAWWRALAEAYGMLLQGWSGHPENGGSASFLTDGTPRAGVIQMPAPLALAMYEMAKKAGEIK